MENKKSFHFVSNEETPSRENLSIWIYNKDKYREMREQSPKSKIYPELQKMLEERIDELYEMFKQENPKAG